MNWKHPDQTIQEAILEALQCLQEVARYEPSWMICVVCCRGNNTLPMPLNHISAIEKNGTNMENELRDWFQDLPDWQPPAYLVGGAVRDVLLRQPARDLDMVHAEAGMLAGALRDHHQATLVELFSNDEIKSTWRLVRKNSTAPQELDLSSFHGSSLQEDLANRDFTINAMAIAINQDGLPGELVDPFNGRNDLLVNKVIRHTSPAAIPADPLRILRAYRFSATLDLTITDETRQAIRRHCALLSDMAMERQLVEFLKILESKRAYAAIRQMDNDGVLAQLFPEINAMRGCAQNSYHHKDVWHHSLLVLQNCEYILQNLADFFGDSANEIETYLDKNRRLPLLKLAALLHDVAKPACKGLREDGRITFYNHDQLGASLSHTIGERLLLGKKATAFLEKLIAGHLLVHNLAEPKVKKQTITRWLRQHGDDCLALLILGLADVKSTLGKDSSLERQHHFAAWARDTTSAYLAHYRQEFKRNNLLSGQDLIAEGITPGPEIGQILRIIRDNQDNGSISSRGEALALVTKLRKQDNG